MDRLTSLLGQERDVDETARTLYGFASDLEASVVGALHVSCSDESERECVEAFQQSFAEHLLPDLKFGERSVFRIANLGGRYEWGAVHIAEEHYSTEEARRSFKLLVVKVNAHVCAERTSGQTRFGSMRRYDTDSVFCGALHALLEGSTQPFVEDLREVFGSEGKDRLALLLDPEQVSPELRSLLVAAVSARLQARRVLVDIQDRRPRSPTLFIVLPCVTLNRKLRDTEIVCGLYRADWRSEEPEVEYRGLGDDPAAYRVSERAGHLVVEDDQLGSWRAARDHRSLVLHQWRSATAEATEAPGARALEEARRREVHRELDRLMSDASQKKHHKADYAKPMLVGLLNAVALLDPITAAVVLFSEGVVGIHHLHRMHRLSKKLGDHAEAHRVLDEIRDKVHEVHPDRAKQIFEVLAAQHRR